MKTVVENLPLPARRAVLRALLAGTVVAAWAPRSGRGRAAGIKPGDHGALIVIDVQQCFVSGGTLAVRDGEAVVPIINRISPAFATVIVTQDWHTPGHVSFASSHPGAKPYDSLRLPYGNQVLWPDHCVQGTADAALDQDLDVSRAELIIRKGYHRDVDSYSAFAEADHRTPTGLRGYLQDRGIRTVYLAGLATDYCVAWTALDARRAGFETYVIEDACRGIDLHGSLQAAWQSMAAHGVKRIRSSDIA